MSFTIKKEDTVAWPVNIQVPVDGGSFKTQQISVKFLLIPVGEAAELTEAAGDADAELLEHVIRDWDLVMDEEGSALPFNDENLRALLAIPYVRRGLLRAYFEAASGGMGQGKN
jgi:hypothetical protein